MFLASDYLIHPKPASKRKCLSTAKKPYDHPQKDPERNPRDIQAWAYAEFKEPETINDVGLQLMNEIDEIRADVRFHWQEIRELSDFEYSPGFEPICDIPIPTQSDGTDVSEYLMQLSLLHGKLLDHIALLKTMISDDAAETLRMDIISRQENLEEIEVAIETLAGDISQRRDRYESVLQADLTDQIEQRGEQIARLRDICTALTEEEEEFMEEQQMIANRAPSLSSLHADSLFLGRKLHGLRSTKARRKAELEQLAKRFAHQKQSVKDAGRLKRRREAENEEAAQWRHDFWLRQQEEQKELVDVFLEVRPPVINPKKRRPVANARKQRSASSERRDYEEDDSSS
jgi:hypothetical protein